MKLQCQCRPKCKICLEEYSSNHNLQCSKQYKCAQCSQNHSSLEPLCHAVQQYRNDLNQAVKQAVNDGVIKLPHIQQVRQQQPYNYDANGFPSLITASGTKPHKAWNNQCNKLNDMTNSQLFSQLKEFFNDKFEQVNKRLNVIEQQVKMNEHNTRSNKIRLSELFLKQKDLISTTLKPALSAIPNIDVKLRENLDDFDKFCSLAEERLRMEYHFSGMTRSLATKSEIILNNNYQPQQ
ncbi:unnamed protein product, partial [Didymodactylos carnosus]